MLLRINFNKCPWLFGYSVLFFLSLSFWPFGCLSNPDLIRPAEHKMTRWRVCLLTVGYLAMNKGLHNRLHMKCNCANISQSSLCTDCYNVRAQPKLSVTLSWQHYSVWMLILFVFLSSVCRLFVAFIE